MGRSEPVSSGQASFLEEVDDGDAMALYCRNSFPAEGTACAEAVGGGLTKGNETCWPGMGRGGNRKDTGEGYRAQAVTRSCGQGGDVDPHPKGLEKPLKGLRGRGNRLKGKEPLQSSEQAMRVAQCRWRRGVGRADERLVATPGLALGTGESKDCLAFSSTGASACSFSTDPQGAVDARPGLPWRAEAQP